MTTGTTEVDNISSAIHELKMADETWARKNVNLTLLHTGNAMLRIGAAQSSADTQQGKAVEDLLGRAWELLADIGSLCECRPHEAPQDKL